jgi:predicted nuclease of predicted toxin-antitoxin system
VKGFLLDENLPGELTFAPSMPAVHALELGNQTTDSELWHHARSREFVIATNDGNFSDRILVSKPPPWIVHLRFGNMRRKEFHRFLGAA